MFVGQDFVKKQLIMTIGLTQNNWELTKEMVENSISSFYNTPIVWNKKGNFNYYDDTNLYDEQIIIGLISENPNIIIEGNNVFADIIILNKFKDIWKGKFNNWCIKFKDEDKTSFDLCSIEVF